MNKPGISAEARRIPDMDASPEEESGRRRATVLPMRAIDDLSPMHRVVVDLTYFHELGYREVAVILECSVNTMKTRMFHARRQLKRRLAGDLEDWFGIRFDADIIRLRGSPHEKAQDLLPWYAKGTLTLADAAMIEAHLAGRRLDTAALAGQANPPRSLFPQKIALGRFRASPQVALAEPIDAATLR